MAFFDLTGSTKMKMEAGHFKGTRQAITHNALTRKICEKLGGKVVKEVGDGILVCFPDPISACQAAICTQPGLKHFDLVGKVSIALGEAETLTVDKRQDILGDTVDRCARIQSLCQPAQVLVDRSVYDAVRTHLKEDVNAKFSCSIQVELKGLGNTEVYELAKAENQFAGNPMTKKFEIHDYGRLSLSEKVEFLKEARNEVIEIGIGLSTLADYFVSRNPKEFREPMRSLLSKGVQLKFYFLEPKWSGTRLYLKDRKEEDYAEEIVQSISKLLVVEKELGREKLSGRMVCYTYRHFPTCYALCVDPEDPKHARMMISPYLFGTKRANNPVYQFSRVSNPKLFETCWVSIRSQIKACRPLTGTRR